MNSTSDLTFLRNFCPSAGTMDDRDLPSDSDSSDEDFVPDGIVNL